MCRYCNRQCLDCFWIVSDSPLSLAIEPKSQDPASPDQWRPRATRFGRFMTSPLQTLPTASRFTFATTVPTAYYVLGRPLAGRYVLCRRRQRAKITSSHHQEAIAYTAQTTVSCRAPALCPKLSLLRFLISRNSYRREQGQDVVISKSPPTSVYYHGTPRGDSCLKRPCWVRSKIRYPFHVTGDNQATSSRAVPNQAQSSSHKGLDDPRPVIAHTLDSPDSPD